MSVIDDGPRVGLVLTGGGARGAFQAGAVRAISEIAADSGRSRPLSIITGCSAGAINATYVSAHIDRPEEIARLADFWGNLRSDQVFRSDARSLSKIGVRWLFDLAFGGLRRRVGIKSLLDTQPLRELITQRIPFQNIPEQLRAGHLDALEVHATDYSTSANVSFVSQHVEHEPWERINRLSVSTTIGVEHVMASSSIPLFFPPAIVEGRYFGDGSLRNTAPLSPAIHLGAERLIIVGVRMTQTIDYHRQLPVKPTVARILSMILNAVFMDAVDTDLERLTRINRTVGLVPAEDRSSSGLRPIEFVYIRPNIDVGRMAANFYDRLPDSLRYLLRGLGSAEEASELVSYLLFHEEYCGTLVNLGYESAMAMRPEITRIFAA